MHRLISFLFLMAIRTFSKVFYTLELKWLSTKQNDYANVRMVVFLNHTSLYEPLFVQAAPVSFLWELSKKLIAPAADKTLNRPIVGRFWKFMSPGLISITRKRDKSWFQFLEAIEKKNIITIAPEGRMKRGTGLDSEGKPMSVRSGIAEIIEELKEGDMLIAYSGGLHHVQHPGEFMPRLFKNIRLNLELVDIISYKKQFHSKGIQFRKDIVADLEKRIMQNCPPRMTDK